MSDTVSGLEGVERCGAEIRGFVKLSKFAVEPRMKYALHNAKVQLRDEHCFTVYPDPIEGTKSRSRLG